MTMQFLHLAGRRAAPIVPPVRFALLIVPLIFLLPGFAAAGGRGVFIESARGDQTVEYQFGDQDFTNDRFGFGLVLDTNVARNELINVRASVGYVYTENKVDEEAHGGSFDIGVGFGLWRTPQFRFWVAPTARIGVDYYDTGVVEVLDLGFGGGVRFGLNWHISRRVSVSPSISYQYQYVRETIKDDFGKDQFDGSEQLITARLTFLFRDLNDVFRSSRLGSRVQ
jgi:hypothetical protein